MFQRFSRYEFFRFNEIARILAERLLHQAVNVAIKLLNIAQPNCCAAEKQLLNKNQTDLKKRTFSNIAFIVRFKNRKKIFTKYINLSWTLSIEF